MFNEQTVGGARPSDVQTPANNPYAGFAHPANRSSLHGMTPAGSD